MTITLKEIAGAMGLSIAAVSRALDGHTDISEETRRRVIETARRMGYVPNRAARQLRRQKADAVGYILPVASPRFADPFTSDFIAGMGDELANLPFDLLISTHLPGLTETEIYANWVQSRKVDGFILNRLQQDDPRIALLNEHNIPYASLERCAQSKPGTFLEVNNAGSIEALVSHLAAKSFSRFAFLGGPPELVIHQARLQGFKNGLKQGGLHIRKEWILSTELTSSSGQQAASNLLGDPTRPDVIMCLNDETAFGALRAARELGLVVGQDVAITGFDGVQASAFSNPPLTTLDFPVYQVARQLVQRLVAQIKKTDLPPDLPPIEPAVLLRASTGD